MVTPTLLLILTAIVAVVVAAPLHALLLLDLVLVVFQGRWSLAGIRVDTTDLVFAAFFLCVVLRRRPPENRFRAIPNLGLWCVLGLLLSASYLHAPMNREYLTDPVRIAYQLYRYAWKPILYYIFAFVLLDDAARRRHAVLAILVVGVLCSLMAIPQGYSGLRARGPFTHGNELGSALIVPSLVAVALVTSRETGRVRLLAALSLPVLARAILFSESRGAMISILLGVAIIAFHASRAYATRSRVIQLVSLVAGLVVVAFLIRPDLLERPTIQRALSATGGTEEATFQWRLKERWPHFFRKSLETPILGAGTDVDWSLGENANTPHNGYIAVAVQWGYPVLIILLVFAITGIVRNLGALSRRGRGQGGLEILTTAAIASILTHNITESVFLDEFIPKLFWIMVVLACQPARAVASEFAPDAPGRVSASRSRQARLGPAPAGRRARSRGGGASLLADPPEG